MGGSVAYPQIAGKTLGQPIGDGDTIVGTDWNDHLLTTNFSETVIGGFGADSLVTRGGNDTLVGGLAKDILVGGLGNDTYVLGAEATGVNVVSDIGGIDTITSTITRSLANYPTIDNLTLLGLAVFATGNNLVNVITGNAAANVLDGGKLGDIMRGHTGNNSDIVDNALDTVDETGGSEFDTVWSSVNLSLSPGAHVIGALERLMLTGTAVNGIGTAFANVLAGNASANNLSGLGGNDTLRGGLGNDNLTGGQTAISFFRHRPELLRQPRHHFRFQPRRRHGATRERDLHQARRGSTR